MNAVVEVRDLAKAYTISHQATAAYRSLREELARAARRAVRPFHKMGVSTERFWALQGVSLEVEAGDVLGIIGRNGSGKSTLLKVLSRIVEPTSGSAILRGRTASLLEVGTGFHPELTGRENVYFNGALLGMSRREISQRFDQIVEFAGTSRFLDTPVKFYSSGMYVRLAFAVAAHVDTDVLIVDEVLAVGDAEFQRKSFGRMKEATDSQGKTVLLVSHSMDAIRNICSRCIWLDRGAIVTSGSPDSVVHSYLTGTARSASRDLSAKVRQGTGRVTFGVVSVVLDEIEARILHLKLTVDNPQALPLDDPKLSIDIHDSTGHHVTNVTNYVVGNRTPLTSTHTSVTLTLRNVNLMPGHYTVNLFLALDRFNSEIFDWVFDAAEFDIPEYDYYGTGQLSPVSSGVIYMDAEFSC